MSDSSSACRECGSTERFTKEVQARGGDGPNLLPIGFFSNPRFALRVCGKCGLVDWFVPERFMPKVREKFTQES